MKMNPLSKNLTIVMKMVVIATLAIASHSSEGGAAEKAKAPAKKAAAQPVKKAAAPATTAATAPAVSPETAAVAALAKAATTSNNGSDGLKGLFGQTKRQEVEGAAFEAAWKKCQENNVPYEQCINDFDGKTITSNKETCERQDKDYKELMKDLNQVPECKGNYSKCLETVASCQADEADLGEGEFVNHFDPKECKERLFSEKCSPGLNESLSSIKTAFKDSQTRRKEAQQDVMKAQREQQKAEAEAREAAVKQQNAMKARAAQIKAKKQQVMEELKKALAEVDAKLGAEFDKTQQVYNQIDDQILKLEDAENGADAEIAKAKIDMQAECRRETEARYRKVEDEIKKRIEQENGARRNQGQAGMAGYYNRQAKQKKSELSLNFATFFKSCLAGDSDVGSAALARIRKLEVDKWKAGQALAKEKVRLEKLRGQELSRLMQSQSMVKNQKNELVQTVQDRMTAMDEEYKTAMEAAESEYSMAMMNASREASALGQELMVAQQELTTAMQEYSLNQSRLKCGEVTKWPSTDDGYDKKYQAYQDLETLLGRREQICATVTSVCLEKAANSTDGNEIYKPKKGLEQFSGFISVCADKPEAKGKRTPARSGQAVGE